jgi:hypothetical protein
MNTDLKIKVKFKEAFGYRQVAATGVLGAPTLSGDLLCNFFLEYRALPEYINVYATESAAPVEETIFPPDGKDVFIRELQVGILLNPQVARSIGEWLMKRADEIMKIQTISQRKS